MVDSETTTRGIHVTVHSNYVPERSQPSQGRWFFSYRIRISNRGSVPVQLLNRHWVITDAHGQIEEVRGPGVIGEQPVMAPGESFEYTSGCPLTTDVGKMEGSYQLVTENGAQFDAEIAPFTLCEAGPIN